MTPAMIHIFACIAVLWLGLAGWNLWRMLDHPMVRLIGPSAIKVSPALIIPVGYMVYYVVWLVAG